MVIQEMTTVQPLRGALRRRNQNMGSAAVHRRRLGRGRSRDRQYGNLGGHTSGASPDGRYLAFMSDRDLTGYDSTRCNSAEPDEEVYLYHAELAAGVLEPERSLCARATRRARARSASEDAPRCRCESDSGSERCGLSAAMQSGRRNSVAGGEHPGLGHVLRSRGGPSAALSCQTAAGCSSTATTRSCPQDVNGTWDVYEYEPPGDGCQAHAGDAAFHPRAVEVDAHTADEGRRLRRSDLLRRIRAKNRPSSTPGKTAVTCSS